MYAMIERPDDGATAKQIITKISQDVALPTEQLEGYYCDNRFPSRKPRSLFMCRADSLYMD